MSFIHQITSPFILYINSTPLAKISSIHPPPNTRQFSILSHPQAPRQLLQKEERWQTLRQAFKAITCTSHLRKTNYSHLQDISKPRTRANQPKNSSADSFTVCILLKCRPFLKLCKSFGWDKSHLRRSAWLTMSPMLPMFELRKRTINGRMLNLLSMSCMRCKPRRHWIVSPHRGKRGRSRKSKKSQRQDGIVTPADSNIGTANVKEAVEDESSLVEAKDITVTPDVSDMRKGEASAAVSNTETAGIQKKKRNRHKPKPPKNGAALWIISWIGGSSLWVHPLRGPLPYSKTQE